MSKFHLSVADKLRVQLDGLTDRFNELAQAERDAYDSHSDAWLESRAAEKWETYVCQIEEAAELLNQALSAMEDGLEAAEDD